MSAFAPDETKKPALQNYLPPGFTLCHPNIGFAHGSLKLPVDYVNLLHYTEITDTFQMTYMLAQSGGAQMELVFIIVKHHLHEGWYLADGAVFSVNDISITQFLHNTRYTRRYQSIEEMNHLVKRIVPKMLRENGVPSIPVLMKYARLDMIHKLPSNHPMHHAWWAAFACALCSLSFACLTSSYTNRFYYSATRPQLQYYVYCPNHTAQLVHLKYITGRP